MGATPAGSPGGQHGACAQCPSLSQAAISVYKQGQVIWGESRAENTSHLQVAERAPWPWSCGLMIVTKIANRPGPPKSQSHLVPERTQ